MLLGGDIRAERNDARAVAMPFIKRSLASSKGRLSNRDRNVHLDPAPAYPDAVAARLEIGNLSDVNGQHTRLEAPEDSAPSLTIINAVSCARKSVTLVNSPSPCSAKGASIVPPSKGSRLARYIAGDDMPASTWMKALHLWPELAERFEETVAERVAQGRQIDLALHESQR